MNIKEYAEVLKEKSFLEITFTWADNEGEVFVAYDGNIKIMLPYSDYFTGQKKGSKDMKRHAASVIRTPRIVLVTEIDEEQNIVTVSYRKAVAESRKMAAASLDKKLEKGEHVRLSGTIIDVYGEGSKSFAVIHLDNNLRGTILCREWNNDYTPDLNELGIIGQKTEVVVTGKHKPGDADGSFGNADNWSSGTVPSGTTSETMPNFSMMSEVN